MAIDAKTRKQIAEDIANLTRKDTDFVVEHSLKWSKCPKGPVNKEAAIDLVGKTLCAVLTRKHFLEEYLGMEDEEFELEDVAACEEELHTHMRALIS